MTVLSKLELVNSVLLSALRRIKRVLFGITSALLCSSRASSACGFFKKKDVLPLGVLVGELCYVAVTFKRSGFDGSHEVDGD